MPLHVQNVRIDEGSAGQRLDNFLAKILKGVPRTHLYRVIRSGEVRVNKGRAAADTRLALGDEVRIPPMRVADRSERPEAPGREFTVVHEDESIVCIDKPVGVAVHGGSGESFGVIEQMRRARPDPFLELVHRLDKETSGLLLLAKTRLAPRSLATRCSPASSDRIAVQPSPHCLARANAGDARGRLTAPARQSRAIPSVPLVSRASF